MKPYFEQDGLRIFNADCREALKVLSDCSVDSIVTDPPYELGFMGKGWDRSGIAYDVEVWRECLRVLKPGGHLLAFGGSRTYHRLACAVEDAGFEIRDQIMWLYGQGFPKSLDVSKAIDSALGAEREVIGRKQFADGTFARATQNLGTSVFNDPESRPSNLTITAPATDAAQQWDGWGTALKPAHEPIVLARKPLIGTVAENVLQQGTGGLNIDECRIETDSRPLREVHPLRPKVPYAGNSLDGRVDGRLQSSKAVGETMLGRWPANVIHDGSDEVLAGFPDMPSCGEYTKSLLKPETVNAGMFFRGGASTRRSELNRFANDTGSAARFFYCAKASKKDRDKGNNHPTVKPTKLMRYLCRLITPPNGIVLDPFGGSGSTAKAGRLEGFNCVLIEKEIEYCEIAKRRAGGALTHGTFLASQQPLSFVKTDESENSQNNLEASYQMSETADLYKSEAVA